MEPKITETAAFYRAWAWFDANKKPVGWGAGIVAGIALVVWFYFTQREETEMKASEAVANVLITPSAGDRGAVAAAYLRIAREDPNSTAGERAQLLGAGSLFTEGRFSEAQVEFDKFVRDHRASSCLTEALLGIAACLEAQNKTNEAVTAYKNFIERHPGDLNVPAAKFALARLYDAQGKPDQALPLYEEANRLGPNSVFGSEAGMRAEELMAKYPNLAPKIVTPTNPPVLRIPSGK